MESLFVDCFVALAIATVVESQQLGVSTTERTVLSVPDLIISYNYSAETHHVTNEDGYVLEMHRVTGSPLSPPANNKPAVFVMHGLISNSGDFASMGPKIGLCYALADAGYDVWLGNARGNTWSKKNVKNLTYDEYWDFSFEEIGTGDLPAMVDYVLMITGFKKIPYIAHSQGTTDFFCLNSLRPEYNEKFSFFGGLGPVAFVANVKSPVLFPLQASAVGGSTLLNLVSIITGKEVLSHDSVGADILRSLASGDSLSRNLAADVLFAVGGYDPAQLNLSMLSTVFDYFPAGSPIRQFIHSAQEMNSKKFRRYDYELLNYQKYGRLTPPDYNVRLITVPCLLVYGENDLLSVSKDVAKLYSLLRNRIELRKVAYPLWSHFDFLWGIDAKKYVHDPLIDTMKRYDVNLQM